MRPNYYYFKRRSLYVIFPKSSGKNSLLCLFKHPSLIIRYTNVTKDYPENQISYYFNIHDLEIRDYPIDKNIS